MMFLLKFGGAWGCRLRFADKLVKKIIQTKKKPNSWSTLVLIYKNKGDTQNFSNHKGIILMSHSMKLTKRVTKN